MVHVISIFSMAASWILVDIFVFMMSRDKEYRTKRLISARTVFLFTGLIGLLSLMV
jgi:TctA family transporter